MEYKNQHCEFIDKRIDDIKKSKKWNTKIIDTTHEEFISDFSCNVFTNFIRDTFTVSYVKKFPCSDCNNKSQERCHGIGEERPKLIKKALEKVYFDISKPVLLRDILIAFLEEHKTTKFTFKCKKCHKNENINVNKN